MTGESRRQQKQSRNSYLNGATRVLKIGLREIRERDLSPEDGLILLMRFGEAIDGMRERKDTGPPFLDRAIRRALVACGYETEEIPVETESCPTK